MARIPVEVENKIKRYLEALKENNIHIAKAYLFGSYARGTFNQWSDIDIALVSDSFKGDRIDDKKIIRAITLQTGSDLEPLPFNPADFTDTNPFVHEIISTGIQIL